MTGRHGTEAGNLSVVMLLEQHLGHETYALNLVRAAEQYVDLDVTAVPIRYDTSDTWIPAWPGLVGLRGTLAGRDEVRAALTRREADAWLYNTQVPAALAGRRLQRPYIVVTDVTPIQYDRIADGYGHRRDHGGPWSAWKHRVNQRVFRGAAWCVPWSTWAAESLAADYHVSATQIAVIPPGVDMKAWRMARPTSVSRTANLRVLFVGADLHRKGGEVLLAAFNSLGDHVELDIVTRSDVVASDRVRVHRALRPNDVQLLDLYRSADVFVLPSLSETFGIAAIEASAAGLPVIASKIGGLTDIVRDGVSGYLLEPGDVSALAAALRRLGSDPLLRVRMGAQARRHASQRFDADTNARRLLDLVRACAVSEVPE